MTGFLDRSDIIKTLPSEVNLNSGRQVPEIVKDGLNAAIDQIELEWYGETSEEPLPKETLKQEVARIASSLRAVYGFKQTAQLCGTEVSEVKKWIAGEALPNEWQWRFLRYALEVTTILRVKLGISGTKSWMNSRSGYLAGIKPIDLMMSDPLGVRSAAMMLVITAGPAMA